MSTGLHIDRTPPPWPAIQPGKTQGELARMCGGVGCRGLERGATSVDRGVSDFKETPVELLAVYYARGSHLHDKVLYRLDGCLGVAIRLRLVL